MAHDAGARSVILTRLGPETVSVAPATLTSAVRATYQGQIIVGADLDHFCITSKKDPVGEPALEPC